MDTNEFPILTKRCAGVLLHPTSLPSSESHANGTQSSPGTLGAEAYNFINFLADSGLKVWQMLPVVPTDNSPYQALSVHAGNPELISLDDLASRNWATADDIAVNVTPDPANARRKCAVSFYKFIAIDNQLKAEFDIFISENSYWLEDFSLFTALRAEFDNAPWIEWPEPIRKRNTDAVAEFKIKLRSIIEVTLFEQFAFLTQWKALKNYAQSKGITFFGDMPIFVGHNSADVWAQPHYFRLDENFKALTVAGVPPDAFSETGQCWGNPHYAWDVIETDGFKWWLSRLKTQLVLFDLIRIDHFRAFEDFWEIPGASLDATQGKWVKAPGDALLTACVAAYPNNPLIAENLGMITKNVELLRTKFELPGMLVLQFAFDGKSDNTYLPENHTAHNVVYTGTHDNDTTLGWYQNLKGDEKVFFENYTESHPGEMPWLLIEMAFSSIAHVAIIPMQDLLELDGENRMNMPGQAEGNWLWRFRWDQVAPSLSLKIHNILQQHNRLD